MILKSVTVRARLATLQREADKQLFMEPWRFYDLRKRPCQDEQFTSFKLKFSSGYGIFFSNGEWRIQLNSRCDNLRVFVSGNIYTYTYYRNVFLKRKINKKPLHIIKMFKYYLHNLLSNFSIYVYITWLSIETFTHLCKNNFKTFFEMKQKK